MPKTKTPPPRKTVKARGALPTPKVTPKRTNTVWHRRKGFRILGALLALLVLGAALKVGLDFRERSRIRDQQARAVTLFDNKYQLYQSELTDVMTSIGKSPAEFAAGTLPAEELKKQADGWLAAFRKLDAGLRNRKIPENLPALEEARALFVHAAVLYIDGVKVYQLAGDLTSTARADAVKQATNIISHGNSTAALGQRELDKLKRRFGLTEEGTAESKLPPIQLPTEDAPPPAPPQGAGQGMPGQLPGQPGIGQPPSGGVQIPPGQPGIGQPPSGGVQVPPELPPPGQPPA